MPNCNRLCNYLTRFLRPLILRLCKMGGIAVLPDGCRAIPAGHFNFDPQIAEQLGGRDGVARAIIFEKIHGWLLYNEARGRNQRNGKTWSWNNYEHWAKEVPFWHQSTIERHIRALEAAGLLTSARFNPAQPKFYSVATKESDEQSQLTLWGGQNDVSGGAKASPTRHKQTFHKPSTAKRTTTATARGAAAVASFQIPQENRELPESSPSMAESRATSNEGGDALASEGSPDQSSVSQTSPSSAPPPSDLALFFSGCKPEELQELLQKYGEARLRHEMNYARKANGILNPPGFALAQLAKFPNRPTPTISLTGIYDWAVNRGFDPHLDTTAGDTATSEQEDTTEADDDATPAVDNGKPVELVFGELERPEPETERLFKRLAREVA